MKKINKTPHILVYKQFKEGPFINILKVLLYLSTGN